VGHPQIAAFARLANGAIKPTRSIAGQSTLMSRTVHDMAYDPVRDEILVPSHYAMAILTFRGSANGDVPPVRKIFGPKTQLVIPEALALDPVHGEIFVPQGRRVLVFSRDADGDVAPIRILEGPDTQLQASRLAVDPLNNVLVVSGGGGIRIYDRTASGNTKPLRFIRTDRSWLLTTNPERGLIFVAIAGGVGFQSPNRVIPEERALADLHSRHDSDDYIGVWSIYDDGNAPPRWTIGGPNTVLRDVRGIALDPKNKTVIVSDKTLNAMLTFRVPEVF
jgi:hypothetical protein